VARPRRKPKTARIKAKRQILDEASTLLLGASVILSGPQRYARRAFALNGRGRSVAVDDPKAARFCLAGALLRAEHSLHGTPMPVRTNEADDVDDLLRPVLPHSAPLRLDLAMHLLAPAAGSELQTLGMQICLVDGDPSEMTTDLHRPLLLGLHPKAHFSHCENAIAVALGMAIWLGEDDERVDRAIRDEALA
jgi:hypothetical protein